MKDFLSALAGLFLSLALWLLLFFVLTSNAAELTEESAASIYALAYGQMPGSLPDVAPQIVTMEPAKLQRMICERSCGIRGLHTRGRIYLDNTLDFADPVDASILLHEMVHYIQWARRGDSPDCAEWQRREDEAYTIQIHVLERAGANLSRVMFSARMARMNRCVE